MSTAEKIRDEGKFEALSQTAIRIMEKKFGTLPEEKKEKIMQMNTQKLEHLIDAVIEYENIEETDKYLQ